MTISYKTVCNQKRTALENTDPSRFYQISWLLDLAINSNAFQEKDLECSLFCDTGIYQQLQLETFYIGEDLALCHKQHSLCSLNKTDASSIFTTYMHTNLCQSTDLNVSQHYPQVK